MVILCTNLDSIYVSMFSFISIQQFSVNVFVVTSHVWLVILGLTERATAVSHRIILHFDLDCFYAQVEMIRNPDLRNKPLGKNYRDLLYLLWIDLK